MPLFLFLTEVNNPGRYALLNSLQSEILRNHFHYEHPPIKSNSPPPGEIDLTSKRVVWKRRKLGNRMPRFSSIESKYSRPEKSEKPFAICSVVVFSFNRAKIELTHPDPANVLDGHSGKTISFKWRPKWNANSVGLGTGWKNRLASWWCHFGYRYVCFCAIIIFVETST